MKYTTGFFIAFCCSFIVNKSIFWAIIQGFGSWFYAIYWMFRYTDIPHSIGKYVGIHDILTSS